MLISERDRALFQLPLWRSLLRLMMFSIQLSTFLRRVLMAIWFRDRRPNVVEVAARMADSCSNRGCRRRCLSPHHHQLPQRIAGAKRQLSEVSTPPCKYTNRQATLQHKHTSAHLFAHNAATATETAAADHHNFCLITEWRLVPTDHTNCRLASSVTQTDGKTVSVVPADQSSNQSNQFLIFNQHCCQEMDGVWTVTSFFYFTNLNKQSFFALLIFSSNDSCLLLVPQAKGETVKVNDKLDKRVCSRF